jgi:tryptophan synthase alpha chain
MAMGLDIFAREVKSAGAEGVIVCDLTPDEESEAWNVSAEAAGLERIYLAAPTSTDKRIEAVCAKGTGFVYAVSRTGVTGAGSQVPPEVASLVKKVKARTDSPVCVGFGISKPEHVKMVCQEADGAVVGSSLVQLLAEAWDGGKGKQVLVDQVRQLKEAAV